ncbi:MAG: hypothetical protein M3256_12430 [Actinomycetota bacterium]|nr:hypothetical protein [Actinomycetota bacterium]
MFGTNVDLQALVALSGLLLVQVTRWRYTASKSLEPQRVLRQLGDFCCGDQYPALCRALMLEK